MANTTTKKKTTVEKAEPAVETVETVKVEAEVVEKKPAAKKVEIEKNDEIEALKRDNADLKNQLNTLMAMMLSNQNATMTANTLDQNITVVHLVERCQGLTTHIKLTNTTIDFSKFGEERLLDRRQVEELIGSFRKLFENGTITLGAAHTDLATKFGVKTVLDYPGYNKDFINRIGDLPVSELERVFDTLADGQKQFVIEYFKRQIIDGKLNGNPDPRFNDIRKIEALNRISNGGMDSVLLDKKTQKI